MLSQVDNNQQNDYVLKVEKFLDFLALE